MNKLKVAIIEDSHILRDMLSELLDDIERVDVAVTAAGQSGALDAMAGCQVNLAIIDLELEEGNGLGVIKYLRDEPEKYGKPKTVVFSNYAVSTMSRHARELGVDRIYDKSFQLPELLDYVKEQVKQV